MSKPARTDPRDGHRGKPRHRWVFGIGIVALMVLLAEATVRLLSPALLPPRSPNANEVARKDAAITGFAQGFPQVIAFGDSTLDAGLVPNTFVVESGRFGSAYNAGLMGARFGALKLWAAHVLSRAKPGLVLQAVDPATVLSLDARVDEAVLDDLVSANVRALDDSFGQQLDRLASDYSYLVRYRGSLRSPRELTAAVQRRLEDKAPEGVGQRPAGFWEENVDSSGQVIAFRKGVATSKPSEGLLTFMRQVLQGSEQFDQLDLLLNTYRSAGVPVVVVIPPVSLEVMSDNELPAKRWEQTVESIKVHAALRDLPVIDFSHAGFAKSEYFDAFHLNADGSTRFSRELAGRLDELCARVAQLRCPPPKQ